MLLQIFCFFLILYSQYFLCQPSPLIGSSVRLAEQNEFPFIVSLTLNKTIANQTGGKEECHRCGGSLISRRHVLTAAHCVENEQSFSDIIVNVGSVNVRRAKTYIVQSWITCGDWAKDSENLDFYYDVAIITLTESVSPDIELPLITMDSHDTLYGRKAFTAGWGLTDRGRRPRHMRTAELQVLRPEQCPFSSIGNEFPGLETLIPKIYMCTKANPPVRLGCGDSGSPLLINKRILIGINTNCWPDHVVEASEYRNVHAAVHFYKSFINYVLSTMNTEHCSDS